MKKTFTLVEILIVLLIVAILATFAIPAYYNVMNNAKARGCMANLRALMAALDIYAIENDRLPGTLGEIPQEYIERAWTKILNEPGAWKIKLAYFLIDLDKKGLAHAGPFRKYYVKDPKQFICPADDRNPIPGYGSYGINSTLTAGEEGGGISIEQYNALPSSTIVIADSKSPDSIVLTHRHKRWGLTGRKGYDIGITKGREIVTTGAQGAFDGNGGNGGPTGPGDPGDCVPGTPGCPDPGEDDENGDGDGDSETWPGKQEED